MYKVLFTFLLATSSGWAIEITGLKETCTLYNVRGNKQKSHKYTAEPTVCPEEWVNAQDVGCFLFIGEDPALSWFDASVACEQVPSPQSRKKGNILQTPNSRNEVISLSLCVSTK